MTRDERGLTESVQWAVLAPLLVGVLVTGLQTALTWHARHVAAHAAAAAAEAGSALGAGNGEAERAARAIIDVGGLAGAQVVVDRQPTLVRVRVSGHAPALLGPAPVEASASSPRERPR